jgi:hypothetical protein
LLFVTNDCYQSPGCRLRFRLIFSGEKPLISCWSAGTAKTKHGVRSSGSTEHGAVEKTKSFMILKLHCLLLQILLLLIKIFKRAALSLKPEYWVPWVKWSMMSWNERGNENMLEMIETIVIFVMFTLYIILFDIIFPMVRLTHRHIILS